MPDRVDLYSPAHEAEANAIAAHLEGHGIDCEVKNFRDGAYGPLFQGQHGWGVLRVPRASEEKARQLLHDWLAAEPGEAPPALAEPAPRTERAGGALLFFALLVSLIANAYFLVMGTPGIRRPPPVVETFDTQGRLNARFQYDGESLPHTILTFDTSGRMVAQAFDADLNDRIERWTAVGAGGVPLTDSFDDNQDGLADRVIRFDGAGRKASEAFDANADQAFEKVIDYAPDGAALVEYWDADADHRFERVVFLRRGQGRAEARDQNGDGVFERALVFDAQDNVIATLDDVDADGVFESVICADSSRAWSILRCGR